MNILVVIARKRKLNLFVSKNESQCSLRQVQYLYRKRICNQNTGQGNNEMSQLDLLNDIDYSKLIFYK